jgi:hypothetical protein
MANSTVSDGIRRGRETNRKRLLREVLESTYQGQAVVLDEVRWNVMGRQIAESAHENARRSLLNSFARTVREQLTEHVIQKVPLSAKTPVGLVARAAVYRMRDGVILGRFLNGEDSCILCRYKTNLEVDEPRYEPWSRYVVPQHHAATFRFFESRPSKITYEQLENVPGTFIPATQKLTLIVPRGTTPDLASIAKVPWKLFGYEDLSDWNEVKGTDPLEKVQRNRYR